VIYTLYRERYSTRKVKSLLRTNTTRPSKCDRTANTMGGWGWEWGSDLWGSGNLCAEQEGKGSCKTRIRDKGVD